MQFDFASLSASERYKLLVSTIVPRPIAWVVTADLDGALNAAPYSFFNVFSNDPPVVVIGIGGRSPGDLKDTGANIRRTGEFVVNLVSEAAAHAMNITAIDFPPEIDEIVAAGLHTAPSLHVRPPRIVESPVALECERLATIELNNDRALVLGRVLAMHIADEAVLDAARCHVDTPKLGLIGRMHGGGWYVRTDAPFEMPRITLADWTEAAGN